MKNPYVPVLALAGSLLLSGCAAARPAPPPRQPYELCYLGEHFETEVGNCVLIRVQDEYRLLRCIPSGPIAGCYDDILSVGRQQIDWSEWVDVESAPGLQLAFLSPVEFAVRYVPETTARR